MQFNFCRKIRGEAVQSAEYQAKQHVGTFTADESMPVLFIAAADNIKR
jgi:hypothetical protein